MFSPRQFVIALTNKEVLANRTVLCKDPTKDYFLHLDTSAGDYFPASGFHGVKTFNSVEDAKAALKYCKEYDPVICHVVCQPTGL